MTITRGLISGGGETYFSQRVVLNDAEFKRVDALPRRPSPPSDLDELARGLTEMLKMPKGTEALWPTQAWALAEAHDFGCLLGAIPVGHGKFLILQLIPVLLEAKRPVLVVLSRMVVG